MENKDTTIPESNMSAENGTAREKLNSRRIIIIIMTIVMLIASLAVLVFNTLQYRRTALNSLDIVNSTVINRIDEYSEQVSEEIDRTGSILLRKAYAFRQLVEMNDGEISMEQLKRFVEEQHLNDALLFDESGKATMSYFPVGIGFDLNAYDETRYYLNIFKDKDLAIIEIAAVDVDGDGDGGNYNYCAVGTADGKHIIEVVDDANDVENALAKVSVDEVAKGLMCDYSARTMVIHSGKVISSNDADLIGRDAGGFGIPEGVLQGLVEFDGKRSLYSQNEHNGYTVLTVAEQSKVLAHNGIRTFIVVFCIILAYIAAMGWYMVSQKREEEQKRAESELSEQLEAVRREKEYQKSIEEELKVINALASDCVSLYTVDLDHNTYKVYAITDEVDDIKSVINEYSDPSKSLRDYADGYVHEEDREKIYYYADLDNMREALRNTRSQKVVVRRNIGGEWAWIEMNIIKAEPVSEPAKNVVLAFTNRSEQVNRDLEIRQKLEDTLSLAESASRAKTTFLNNMSHDIRTPMNAILGFTNKAIKDIDDKEKVLDSLEKVKLSGRSLLGLINDILDMSRIESGKVTITRDESDMNRSFTGIEPMLRELADSKNIRLSFSIGDIRHRYNYVDFSHTERVLVNIISNAIKYTPNGGKVDVSVCELDETVDGKPLYRFTVADNGQGMSEEFQKSMYEEFSREKNSTQSGVVGTGLGLALSKSLVELMGGRIYCESRLGEGTTFTIDLPFETREESTTDEEHTAYAPPDYKLSGKRILLVEDNEMNREIATEILEEEGILVETAEDGYVAVEMIRRLLDNTDVYYYDAVLMDIQMPRMNGYEATKAIRELPDPLYTHLPIIALSANAFEEDRQKSLAAGMDDHIAKPIDIQQLKETLAKYL